MQSKNRISIVHDEHIIANTLARVFAGDSHEAHAAYSAVQAHEFLAELQPDLAIRDVGLKEMNAVNLTLLLKGLYPSCQITLFIGLLSLSVLLEKAREVGQQCQVFKKPTLPTEMFNQATRWFSGAESSGLSMT